MVNHRWDTLCLSHAFGTARAKTVWPNWPVFGRGSRIWKDDAKDLDEDDGECDFGREVLIDDFGGTVRKTQRSPMRSGSHCAGAGGGRKLAGTCSIIRRCSIRC